MTKPVKEVPSPREIVIIDGVKNYKDLLPASDPKSASKKSEKPPLANDDAQSK